MNTQLRADVISIFSHGMFTFLIGIFP